MNVQVELEAFPDAEVLCDLWNAHIMNNLSSGESSPQSLQQMQSHLRFPKDPIFDLQKQEIVATNCNDPNGHTTCNDRWVAPQEKAILAMGERNTGYVSSTVNATPAQVDNQQVKLPQHLFLQTESRTSKGMDTRGAVQDFSECGTSNGLQARQHNRINGFLSNYKLDQNLLNGRARLRSSPNVPCNQSFNYRTPKEELSSAATLEAISKLAVIAKRAFGNSMAGDGVMASEVEHFTISHRSSSQSHGQSSSDNQHFIGDNSVDLNYVTYGRPIIGQGWSCQGHLKDDLSTSKHLPPDHIVLMSGASSRRTSSTSSTSSLKHQPPMEVKDCLDGRTNTAPQLSKGIVIEGSRGSSRYEEALARLTTECLWRRKIPQVQGNALVYWSNTVLPSYSRRGDLLDATLATKVFLGGLPYDATQLTLMSVFSPLGVVSVQVPTAREGSARRPSHAYLVFENQLSVRRLLGNCTKKGVNSYYFWVPSMRAKGGRLAQVIPWATEDNDWIAPQFKVTRPRMTQNRDSSSSSTSITISKDNCIFIGGVHGEVSAEGLQLIMGQLFGPVLHSGIDTDSHGYPSGSARVTFADRESFYRALNAGFVRLETARFSKLMQIDPFVDEVARCVVCEMATSLLCRHPSCLRYLCPICFEQHRDHPADNVGHIPLMRPRTSSGYNSSLSTL